MKRNNTNLRFALTLILAGVPLSAVSADPTSFFPSTQIHEDDQVGEYYLKADGCLFELAHYIPNRNQAKTVSVTKFDLSFFDTGSSLVHAPFKNAPLSRRHSVAWFAHKNSDLEVANINSLLRKSGPNFGERINYPSDAAIVKSKRLAVVIEQLEKGDFGQFAARNYAKTVFPDGLNSPLSAYVLYSFSLPVKRDEAPRLIEAIDHYRTKHCETEFQAKP